MEILASAYYFSEELSSLFLIQTAFFLKNRIELSSCTVLKNEVKVVIILIVIMKLNDVLMIEIVHDFNLKFDLLNQIMLYNLNLVDDFDGKNVF